MLEFTFDGGKFVSVDSGLNYQEVLDDFSQAKTIRIITYNISGNERYDQLLKLLQQLPNETDVKIITNIPSRFESYYNSSAGVYLRRKAKSNIEVYLKKLNPALFNAQVIPYFNFSNHAKVIGTENIVYIGSANFSNESQNNIETGIIIKDKAFIHKLYTEFFENVKENSTPYFDDDFNVLRLLVISLFSKFRVHYQILTETLFFRHRETGKWVFVGGETTYSSNELSELVLDLHGLSELDVRAENTYTEYDSEYNEKIEEIISLYDSISIQWLIEISSTDDCLYNLVNFDFSEVCNDCLEEYSMEAYDEYLETYIDKATDDTNDILNDLSTNFETVSIDFISEIEKILDVLEKIYTIIEEYSLTRISTDIDNT